MGSLEDLFEREEIMFNSYNNILNYLSNDGKRNKLSYKNVAVQLAEPTTIKNNLEEADSVDKLKQLRKDIMAISISNAKIELEEIFDVKMQELKLAEKISIKEEQKLNKNIAKLNNLEVKIELATSLGEINSLNSKINELEEEEINVDRARGLINDRIFEIEEQKEITKQRQIESRQRKEELRSELIEPDF